MDIHAARDKFNPQKSKGANKDGNKWSVSHSNGDKTAHFGFTRNVNDDREKMYDPKFEGEFVTSGGGGKGDPPKWSAEGFFKVPKDNTPSVEIWRSVAGGAWHKISDETNVDPVIVGQKIDLKVVVKPAGTTFSHLWSVTGGNPEVSPGKWTSVYWIKSG